MPRCALAVPGRRDDDASDLQRVGVEELGAGPATAGQDAVDIGALDGVGVADSPVASSSRQASMTLPIAAHVSA